MGAFSETIFKWLGFARFNATLPTTANGATQELQCDSKGRLRVVTTREDAAATTWARTATSTYTKSVTTSAASLYGIRGRNEGTTEKWLMVFDAAATPSNGTAPLASIGVPAGGTFSDQYDRPLACASGIHVQVSSTKDSLTSDSGATFWFAVEYGS